MRDCFLEVHTVRAWPMAVSAQKPPPSVQSDSVLCAGVGSRPMRIEDMLLSRHLRSCSQSHGSQGMPEASDSNS